MRIRETAWKVVHKLSEILLLTIFAVISGAEGWEDIEDFGEIHLDFLKQYGDFENGIPVHDTIALALIHLNYPNRQIIVSTNSHFRFKN
ncbi:transposase family protein [Escherichia coli]|uniref:transposase family protein n=1 Tax=Escherichia coli TaxID=562 RepID=UPI00301BCDBF